MGTKPTIRLITALALALAVMTLTIVGFLLFHKFDPAWVATTPQNENADFEHWRVYLGRGESLGSLNAPVQLMEFEGVACPSCGGLGEGLKTLQGCYPDLVAVTFLPLALPTDQYRKASSQAAEGSDPDDLPGTPLLLINGWRLERLPSQPEFDQMIMAILAGEKPVSEFQASADAHGVGSTGLAPCTPKDPRSQTPYHLRNLRDRAR